MPDGQLHARVQWKTGCGVRAAVHEVTRAWSGLSKSIGLRGFHLAYQSSFRNKGSMAVLLVLESREDVFTSLTARVVS